MIRGAIDYADQQRVGGWIYSDVAPVSGRTVLAFLDKDCVGAGALDVFRQDLADAGLGDGMVGFNFEVGAADEDMARVTVRLEGSDFCLIQPQARVASEGLVTKLKAKKQVSADEIAWLKARGWIDQSDHDFLTYLADIGLYERSLRARGESLTAEAEARRLLELYAQGPLAISAERMALGELGERRVSLMAELAVPIVAVHGEAGALALLEGSNGDEDFYRHKDLLGAVQHRCGSDRLLLLDLRSQVQGVGDGMATVYLAR